MLENRGMLKWEKKNTTSHSSELFNQLFDSNLTDYLKFMSLEFDQTKID